MHNAGLLFAHAEPAAAQSTEQAGLLHRSQTADAREGPPTHRPFIHSSTHTHMDESRLICLSQCLRESAGSAQVRVEAQSVS